MKTAVPALALALALVVRPAGAQNIDAAAAGRVVSDTVWSQALGTRKAMLVYLPPSYAAQENRRYPVLYYLHGLNGNERNWIEMGKLDVVMDSLVRRRMPEMIVVMPDGDDSWYTTWNALNDPQCQRDTTRKEPAATFCVSWPHYDDYLAREVVAHVDRRYRTRAERAHRGIAGLSMGGYGAISLALRYPDVFAAASSHSGVVSPAFLPAVGVNRVADLERAYGKWLWKSMVMAFGRDSTGWLAREPRLVARRLVASGRDRLPAIRIDVGVEDWFLEQNRAFHEGLAGLKVDHVYHEYPGKHDWTYWRAHLPESLTWLAGIVAR